LISYVAQIRPFEPGSIVGLRAISNEDESASCACLGEVRALEMINNGKAVTEFLKFGDSVKIEHFNHAGNSIFGYIEQRVVVLD